MFLHPLNTFALLCAGVLIVGWTYQVIAATVVSSVIEAPPLQSAARILKPSTKTTVKASSLDVVGTCPSRSYIKLAVNGAFGGVAWCDQHNNFTIKTSLHAGTNIITPQNYNETDLPGPTSDSVEVAYDPPAPAPVPHASPTQTSNVPSHTSTPAATETLQPLLLSSSFRFQTFTTAKNFSWAVDLEGGVPPYDVQVDWGDHQTSHLVFKTDPVFTIKHHYAKAGYYAVVVNSTDTTGQQQVMQLAALITDKNGHAPFLTGTISPPPGSPSANAGNKIIPTAKWLLVAWPIYAILVLMTISFWLGERREFVQLKIRRTPTSRPRAL